MNVTRAIGINYNIVNETTECLTILEGNGDMDMSDDTWSGVFHMLSLLVLIIRMRKLH